MKIVIALDKFKGSLTAPAACEIVRRVLCEVQPGVQIIVKPMADGGDGTAEALHAALGGEWMTQQVTGPLPALPVKARYLWLARERRAFIEMAQASGLVLLPPAQRNPLLTTTLGTGELLADAIRRGADRIWLAIGGSATTDGGVGAAMALGWRFLDAASQPVQPVGGELERIVTLCAPLAFGSDRRSALPGAMARGIRVGRARTGAPTVARPSRTLSGSMLPPIEVLCDVDNPLCGDRGAACVFGPQKGATPAMVQQLDAGLRHLAAVVKAQLGKDILDVPGAGAAGGLGGGALAFLNARLVPGIETVMSASRLAEDLAGADWVVTGEGQFDEQSLHGKVVAGVTALAQAHGVKVAVLAGRVKVAEADWRRAGISIAQAIAPATLDTPRAIQQAPELLAAAVRKLELL